MPNWCGNTLTVEGPREELTRFREDAIGDEGVFSLDKLLPYPEEFRKKDLEAGKAEDAWKAKQTADGFDMMNTRAKQRWLEQNPHPHIRDGYNSGGLEWCRANWGTKWDVVNVSFSESNAQLAYSFETAWSPPIAGIENISRLYPELKFSLNYEEPGMAFEGDFEVQGGDVLLDDQRDMEEECPECENKMSECTCPKGPSQQTKEWEERWKREGSAVDSVIVMGKDVLI